MKKAKSLKELYEEAKDVPRAFIRRCAEVTMKSEVTVRGWLSGAYVPDELAKSRLAELFDTESEALFPNNKELDDATRKNA